MDGGALFTFIMTVLGVIAAALGVMLHRWMAQHEAAIKRVHGRIDGVQNDIDGVDRRSMTHEQHNETLIGQAKETKSLGNRISTAEKQISKLDGRVTKLEASEHR